MNFVLAFCIILICQSLYNIYIMIWAWNHPQNAELVKPPSRYLIPQTTFTIILPAWNEPYFDQTILSCDRFDYPKELYEVLIPLRVQDPDTIRLAERTLAKIDNPNFKIILVDDKPFNKPNQLNHALKQAKGQIVTIFDAEDDPSMGLLNIVNTKLLLTNADVIQCNVQLINYTDTWFSVLNCMEYYFWFKSSLNYFASHDVMPLAGNTVFLKTHLVKKLNGWDETCLTEDGELGLRLAIEHAKFEVIYDAKHATLEESPTTNDQFIKQRTRWVQGFINIFMQGKWLQLDSLKKQFIFVYILLWPALQSLLIVYLFTILIVSSFVKIDLVISVLSFVPMFLLFIQLLITNYGVVRFTQEYKLQYKWHIPFTIIFTFVPYQMVLAYASLRATYREFSKQTNWEKTIHTNAHRKV